MDKIKRLPELRIIIILAAFVFGILLVDLLPIATSVIIFVTILLSSFFTKKKFLLFVLIFFILVGGVRYYSYRCLPASDISNLTPLSIKYVDGTVETDMEKVKSGYRFILDVSNVKYNSKYFKQTGKIIVHIKNEKIKLRYNDKVRIYGFFYEPLPQSNPLKFEYDKYLARKNIYLACSLKEENNVKILKHIETNNFVYLLKHYIINAFSKGLNKDVSELLMGMILGNASYLQGDVYDNFMRTSTLHLLAASGFNCYILVVMCQIGFFFIPYRCRGVITIFTLWVYSLMIGLPASILRASVMSSLFISGSIFKLYTSFKHILFLSALLILIYNPASIFDIGFQLSYLCLFGLLYIMPVFMYYIKKYKLYLLKRNCYKKNLFISSFIYILVTISSIVSVSFGVTPLILYYFNYFSFFGVLTNFLVGSLAAIIFFLAVLYLLLYKIPYLSSLLVYLLNFIGLLILKVVNYFGGLSNSVIYVASPNIVLIFIYYLILIYICFIYSLKIIKK